MSVGEKGDLGILFALYAYSIGSPEIAVTPITYFTNHNDAVWNIFKLNKTKLIV